MSVTHAQLTRICKFKAVRGRARAHALYNNEDTSPRIRFKYKNRRASLSAIFFFFFIFILASHRLRTDSTRQCNNHAKLYSKQMSLVTRHKRDTVIVRGYTSVCVGSRPNLTSQGIYAKNVRGDVMS